MGRARGWTPAFIVATLLGTAPGASAQEPQVLAPGTISTDAIEYGPAFSPSGDSLYFTRRASFREPARIFLSVRNASGWGAPELVAFGSDHGDEYPSISSDGRRLYFASKRPAQGSDAQGQNDLWVVERTESGWSTPRHIGGALSTPDVESHPVEGHGGLYFHSRRGGGTGDVDAYFAPAAGDGFGAPELLPFNSPEIDGEVAPAPGGGVVFYSDRPGGAGLGDLYFAARVGDGWGEPRNLGSAVNTAAYEWTPTFDPAGALVFARLEQGGGSDLYVTEFSAPE